MSSKGNGGPGQFWAKLRNGAEKLAILCYDIVAIFSHYSKCGILPHLRSADLGLSRSRRLFVARESIFLWLVCGVLCARLRRLILERGEFNESSELALCKLFDWSVCRIWLWRRCDIGRLLRQYMWQRRRRRRRGLRRWQLGEWRRL